MNQKQNEIKDYTYKSDVQDDLISSKSLLKKEQFTSALEFDRQFEGVPAGKILFSQPLRIKKRTFDDTVDGIWIGLSQENLAQVFLGSPSNEYIKVNGTNVDIVGSTITGGTIQTASTGKRIRMTSTDAEQIDFLDGSTLYGSLKVIESGSDKMVQLLDSNAAKVSIGGTSTAYHARFMLGYSYFGAFFESGEGRLKTTLRLQSSWYPWTAGTYDLGNSLYYWNDINYKTLTDRGCLGWFDDGVELQNGSLVSDVEAIQAIKKHKSKKTIYGKPMLDYKTFPKVSYKKADKGGADGVEMTSMFSIMFGAIKELDNRLKELENNHYESK